MAEAIVASGVCALSIMGLASLQGMVLRMDQMAQHSAAATAACQAKTEEIQAQDPAARSSGSDSFAGLARAWTLSSGSSTGVSALVVTASWTNLQGGTHSMSLQTMVAN